jgi:RNA polymerase sigma factor (sigma-70 family)
MNKHLQKKYREEIPVLNKQIDDSQKEIYKTLRALDKIQNKNATLKKKRWTRISFYIPLLTKRQERILRHRYEEDLTLQEIANIYKVTRERIRQVEERAFKIINDKISYENVYYRYRDKTRFQTNGDLRGENKGSKKLQG